MSSQNELTRLSGEQAEERGAREGRKCRWCKADELPGHSPMYCVATLDAACSRLASRVEELQRALRSVYEITAALEKSVVYEIAPPIMTYMETTNRKVESLLAGAHAEEKE